MSLLSFASNLLTNKYVLYFVVFLAVTNVLGYIMVGKFKTVIFFVLVSLLASYFSRNMIVVLLVGLLTTNLMISGTFLKEGLENANLNTMNSTTTDISPDIEDDEEKLGTIDAQLKKGIDVLREMNGDVSKAKEVLEKQTSEMKNIEAAIGEDIKDPNNPTMNKPIEALNEPIGKSETTTKSTQGFRNIHGSPLR